MSAPVIAARGLAAGYNRHPVLEDLDLDVAAGEVVALVGPNGAGKTTTLAALAGVLSPLAGTVEIDGVPRRNGLHRRAHDGLGLVTEERAVFMRLTVRQNLTVAGAAPEPALALFPELEPLLGRKAGLLSGGEQQMLALAMALGRSPRVLLIDELSLGLAPLIVNRLLAAVKDAAAASGIAILLVEQKVDLALRTADRIYVMQTGRIVLHGPAIELTDRIHELEESYLGVKTTSTPDRPNDEGASA